MSFILDALRKSEHERQRSTVPGLAQVPLATPQPQMPRWALAVIGVLGAAVLALAAAWWQSTRSPAAPAAASAALVERNVALPPAESASAATGAAPRAASASPSTTAPPSGAHAPAAAEPFARTEPSPLERAALSSVSGESTTGETGEAAGSAQAAAAPTQADFAPRSLNLPADASALPSAAALAAEGVQLPPLRLELHAFSAQPKDRFVFVNGRKYGEGERLTEGPQVVSIEPTGVVLAYAGRRFLLLQD